MTLVNKVIEVSRVQLLSFFYPHLRTFSFAFLEREEGRERDTDVREASIGCLRTHPDRGSALGPGIASVWTRDESAT